MDKKIIYSIFLEISKHTPDPFWKCIFENISFGKMNKYFYIYGNTIYSTNKNRMFIYTINPKQDFKITSHELCQLFMENTNIFSSKNNNEKTCALEQKRAQKNIEQCWGNIKKKNIKETLIIDYINDMRIQYRLNWEQTKQLYNMIQLSFMLKCHNSSDIKLENGKIKHIDGIEYEDGNFVNHYVNKQCLFSQTEDFNGDYVGLYWDKYAKLISKLII